MIVPEQQKIAVVGAGVAGLTAAWLLSGKYKVTLYEKNDYAGGHTRTIRVPDGSDAGTPVDTGFIVMNERNYPLLTRLLDRLQVERRNTDMSFAYSCERSGYTYAGSNLKTLFAQKRNLLNAGHWGMIKDILKFNQVATTELQNGRINGDTLGDYIGRHRLGTAFRDHYLYAMGSAIWSAPARDVANFPAQPFVHFFHNHGLLGLKNRPQWQYVKGGSRTYVERMLKDMPNTVRLNTAVKGIRRTHDGLTVQSITGEPQRYDRVVIAAHADEACRILIDPTRDEQQLLGAWKYQENQSVLHHDESAMPPTPNSWSAWNLIRESSHDKTSPVSVTYDMTRLQRLRSRKRWFVSLNRHRPIAPEKVVDRTVFTHPVFSFDSINTQSRLRALNEGDTTYFCGSYFGYGFHEDAVRSAVQVAEKLGVSL
jgi:predicted NAD/FAD-binding protein